MEPKLWSRIIAVLLLWGCLGSPTPARSAQPRAQEFFLTETWATDEGLPQNSATCIAQAPDGFLWIGTFNGLARFDGLKFTVLDQFSATNLPSARITKLHFDREGRLWLSLPEGPACLEQGRFQIYGQDRGWPGGLANSMLEDSEGRLVASTQRGLIVHMENGRWVAQARPPGNHSVMLEADLSRRLWGRTHDFVGHFTDRRWVSSLPADEETNRVYVGLAAGRGGGMWVADENEIRLLHRGRWERRLPRANDGQNYLGLYEDSRGNLWTASYARGLECFLPDGRMLPLNTANGMLPHNSVRAVREDREGNLWVGLDGGGLVRLKKRDFIRYGPRDGLTEKIVKAVVETAPDEMWIGTYGGGVQRWVNGRLEPAIANGPLKSNSMILALAVNRAGDLFIGGAYDSRGLYRLSHGVVTRIPLPLPDETVLALAVDETDTCWIGTQQGLFLERGGQVARFGVTNGLNAEIIRVITPGAPGEMWLGTDERGLFRFQNGKFTALAPTNAAAPLRVSSLLVESNNVWIGTHGDGLWHRRADGRFDHWSVSEGLPGRNITCVLADDADHLWLGSDKGVVRVRRRQLDTAVSGAAHAGRALNLQVFTRSDGLGSIECSTGGQPAGWADNAGRLWFATINGLSMVDPSRLGANRVVPPVAVEQVQADGVPLWAGLLRPGTHPPANQNLVVPAGCRRLEIRWAALSLTAPEKVRCQILLEGFDQNWLDVGSQREAIFYDLSPGDYHFHVRAANNDGVWNKRGVSLAFSVLPRFYQTLWFQLTAGLSVLTLVAGGAWRIARVRVRRQIKELAQERALAAERARLSLLLEATTDLTAFTNVEGHILLLNPAGHRLLGLAPDADLRQRRLAEFQPPWAVELVQRTGLPHALEQGFWQGDTAFLHADGREIPTSQTLIAHQRPNGAIDFFSIVARDLTAARAAGQALRESEARYRIVAEQTGQIVYDYDSRSGVIRWAGAVERLTGYTVEEFAARDTKGWAELIHPDDRPAAVALLEQCEKTGAPYRTTYRLCRKNGDPLYVEDNGVFLRNETGDVGRMLGVMTDISERHRLEEERSQMDRKLQEAQKLESLGVLAGGIAHDFNNLLTSILGNASLARMDLPPGSHVQPCLERIEQTSKRAAELCQQMLAYSGRGRFVVQRLDLNQIIQNTTHLIQISIGKSVVLRFDLAPNLPVVSVDATQIRQIIMNLVINASEAIGDHSGVIVVSTGLTRAVPAFLQNAQVGGDLPPGDYVLLEVADNGSGMSQETLARIFDPFFTTKFTGRGLGLAAVLGIVRGHHGALKVESQPGRGTVFRLLLPPAEGPVEVPPAPSAAPAVRPDGGTVLVVEDEETVRVVVARMLETLGLRVLLAANGVEALEQYRAANGKLQLVLLDLTMPRMGGEETAAELRKLNPELPVLLMSGYSEHEAMGRFAGKGLAGFIQKPFRSEELCARVCEILIVKPEAPPAGGNRI